MRTELIQQELRRIGVDGWLFFDHPRARSPGISRAGAEAFSARHAAVVLLRTRLGRTARIGPSDRSGHTRCPARPQDPVLQLGRATCGAAFDPGRREECGHAVLATLRDPVRRQRGRGHGRFGPQSRRRGGQLGGTDPNLRGPLDAGHAADAPGGRQTGGPASGPNSSSGSDSSRGQASRSRSSAPSSSPCSDLPTPGWSPTRRPSWR